MLDKEITSRINELNPQYREWILSGSPRIIAETFAEAHNFDDDQKDILENGFVLYLIFFFTEIDLIDFITNELKLSLETTEKLVAGLQLALPKEIAEIHLKTNELIENNQINLVENNVIKPANTLNDEIKEAEATLKSLRTMADDQLATKNDAERVYPSSQADLLQKKNPSPTSPPRWESEG